MSQFSDFTAGIEARLKQLQQRPGSKLAGVEILTEDTGDLETAINKAVDELGMMVLIGEPPMDNSRQSVRVANMTIKSELGVAENPLRRTRGAWRPEAGRRW